MANGGIINKPQDGTALPNAPAGEFIWFMYTDGTIYKKDDSGVITPAYDVDTTATTWGVHGSSQSAGVTNSYLRSGGDAFMNISPAILPFNATLIAITAATEVSETWTAEVHSGLTLVPGATLSITAATSGVNSGLSIDLNAGDPIEFFVNGSTIRRPNIMAFFVRR